ncbi:YbaB/EbfC family nucleoid-associated protein [Catenulispora sp. NF23]|uniref:YbaB/EbfC family nucleoid-associated protein n=2 Tax=Catenulispora TaxID=414878 RepID=A0ABS5L2J5_9ACTN|nr:YbaB/EbfC family nucleoid-associated protein [Catenulispora pinistramenti]MBS2536153.1 YbaB/EbfC family nucleoid-associated protein [Catenulispora pinistramenti]MBS2552549.1 YbaB/EbfC family nucleoid-associated protein [Catenulispora pinistramenti]
MTTADHRPDSHPGLAFDRAKIAELVADSERRMTAIADAQQRMAELTVSTRSRDRSLSVGLGAGGVLTELTFHTTAYRDMAPAQLSKLVLDTVTAARAEYAEHVSELMAPVRAGAALPYEQIMAGTFDVSAFLREGHVGLADQGDQA